MSTNNEPPVSGEGTRNPEVNYERRDLSVRAVFAFFISLAIAGVIVQVALWGVFKYLGPQKQAHPTQLNAIETSSRQIPGGDPAVRFPAPQLQPNPPADLNKFRTREEQVLNSYGWVDQSAGLVHIPIEKAIEILVQSGLPVRPQPALSPPGVPAQSASGKGPGKTISGTEPASKQ